jgi:SAM-dependent methyltransferase
VELIRSSAQAMALLLPLAERASVAPDKDFVAAVCKAVLPQRSRMWLSECEALIRARAEQRRIRRSVMSGITFRSERAAPSGSSSALLGGIIPLIQPDSLELAAWFHKYASGQRERLAYDLDYVREYFRLGDDILEFGSIPLLLTAAVTHMGYRVHGVDLAPERFQKSATTLGLSITKCDVEREPLPFPDSSFRGMLFNEMFEHLRINLIHTFREVFRVLCPGGVLLMSTPHLRSLQMLLNFALTNRPYGNSGDLYTEYEKIAKVGHMGHVREYTTFEVCEFLKKIGFSVCSIIYRGSYVEPWKRAIVRALPGLRPFVTYVATR